MDLVPKGEISKHLMLLFNYVETTAHAGARPFQNISCYCLTSAALYEIPVASISKHLMLLFNKENKTFVDNHTSFQNISCYCLTG